MSEMKQGNENIKKIEVSAPTLAGLNDDDDEEDAFEVDIVDKD